MRRAIIIVMDSVGIGSSEDAEDYGDKGADTLGHIADYCLRIRRKPLEIPTLCGLGLGEASLLSMGRRPPGLQKPVSLIGRYGFAVEQSKGKDTPSGHWEIDRRPSCSIRVGLFSAHSALLSGGTGPDLVPAGGCAWHTWELPCLGNGDHRGPWHGAHADWPPDLLHVGR